MSLDLSELEDNICGKLLVVLADLVLSNKLVLYDLEKQAIGWTEYNCKLYQFDS